MARSFQTYLRRKLLTLDGGESILPALAGDVRALVDAEKAVLYRPVAHEDQLAIEFVHWSGYHDNTIPARQLAEFVGASDSPRFASYDASSPERSQRNRVRQFEPPQLQDPRRMAPIAAKLYPSLCLYEQYTMRILICDGPRLLGWVGAFRGERFRPEESARLQRLMRPLQRRLRWERRLAQERLSKATALVAMELLPAPAFVLDVVGRVCMANSAGASWLRNDRATLRTILRETALHESRGIEVWPICEPGLPRYRLAVCWSEASTERVQRARTRWDLTPRQAEILEHVVRGLSNKEIASALHRSVKTVEVHLGATMAKAGVDSRTLLVSRFYSL